VALTIVASGVFAPQSGTVNSVKSAYAGSSGYIITAGQVVGTDPNTGFIVPVMAASGFNNTAVGVALNTAYNNQPVSYCTKGIMSLGVTGAGSGLTVGQAYSLDYATSGGIIPDSALVSGAYVVQLGYCSVSGFINLSITNTNVQLA
jgi:hypothetical protein